jgi:hypothetical protein
VNALIFSQSVDARVVRCQWCAPRIGRPRFFAGGDFSREVSSPAGLGLVSDTICPDCLEVERVRLEQMSLARAA